MKKKASKNAWTRIGLRIREKDKAQLEQIAAQHEVKVAAFIRGLVKIELLEQYSIKKLEEKKHG